jgi:hypothetical protein
MVAAKLVTGSLRAQDLGPALRQPGDGHFQAVIDEVDIGARAVVTVHDALPYEL